MRARLPHQARPMHSVRGHPARPYRRDLEPTLGWRRRERWAVVSERRMRLLCGALLFDVRLFGIGLLRLLARPVLLRRRALPSSRARVSWERVRLRRAVRLLRTRAEVRVVGWILRRATQLSVVPGRTLSAQGLGRNVPKPAPRLESSTRRTTVRMIVLCLLSGDSRVRQATFGGPRSMPSGSSCEARLGRVPGDLVPDDDQQYGGGARSQARS